MTCEMFEILFVLYTKTLGNLRVIWNHWYNYEL